jgi:hypothetical protein
MSRDDEGAGVGGGDDADSIGIFEAEAAPPNTTRRIGKRPK